MVNFFTPPGLEGLYDLDAKGVDIRPTLLRVLTDQFLQLPTHTPEEEQHYSELATRLLNEVDIATRAAVSVRLAPYAGAPRSIMLDLARDVLEVAEPVLLYSPCLTPRDCEAIIAERGHCYADILARRKWPESRAEAAAAPAPTIPIQAEAMKATPAEEAPIQPTPEPTTPLLPVVDLAPSAEEANPDGEPDAARELCELFFAAGSPERRLILLNLDFVPWQAEATPASLQRADIWRMETAALRHNTTTVMQEIERALGISHQQARRLVEDDQGEPIVVAAKAMSLPADVLQRILLFMNPRVGQSVDRVYELAALYNEISVEAAQRLVSILRAAAPAERKSHDTRAAHPAIDTARRALSDTTGTSARKPEAPVVRRAASDR